MKSPALYLGAFLVFVLASCDGFLYQEPTTEISRAEALNDIESVESALFGAYNLTMRRDDTYRSFLTYYADLAAGNVTINPGLTSGAEPALRRIEAFDGLSDQTVEAYTALYELLYAVNNVVNAIPDLPDGTVAEKNRLLGQALGLRAMLHFDLVRLYAQPYNFTDDASHIGIVVLTESPRPDEQRPRTSVRDAYDQIVNDLERSIDLLDGEAFNPRFINAVNARALLSRVYLYQGEWARVVTLCNEVIDSNATTLAPTDEMLEMWQNGYTRNEFLLRLDGSANAAYTLSSEWGNRVSDRGPVLSATPDIIDLYPDGDRRGLGTDRLIQTTATDGDTVYSTQKYPEPLSQEPNNIGLLRLAEVYLNRAEAYARLNRNDPARDDLNTIRQRAHPTAPRVTASGPALLDEILLERRKELAFEGHLLFDRTRTQRGVDRDYCDDEPWCDEAYPSPRFVLPIPLDAINANDALQQNDGY